MRGWWSRQDAMDRYGISVLSVMALVLTLCWGVAP